MQERVEEGANCNCIVSDRIRLYSKQGICVGSNERASCLSLKYIHSNTKLSNFTFRAHISPKVFPNLISARVKL